MLLLLLPIAVPLLVIYCTWKKPVRQMVLWSVASLVILALVVLLGLPIGDLLKYGHPISWAAILDYWNGESRMILHLMAPATIFGILAIPCAAEHRMRIPESKKDSHTNEKKGN